MKRVFANGFPKAGNHALVKACHLLALDCAVEHLPYVGLAPGPTVFIKRDPRNIIMSWLRHSGQAVARGPFMVQIHNFMGKGPIVDQLAAYEGWLNDRDTLVVSYEALTASPVEMQRIAEFAGVEFDPDVFDLLPGLTRTWFPDHSDWQTIWTPQVEKAWNDAGGADLLTRLGY